MCSEDAKRPGLRNCNQDMLAWMVKKYLEVTRYFYNNNIGVSRILWDGDFF